MLHKFNVRIFDSLDISQHDSLADDSSVFGEFCSLDISLWETHSHNLLKVNVLLSWTKECGIRICRNKFGLAIRA